MTTIVYGRIPINDENKGVTFDRINNTIQEKRRNTSTKSYITRILERTRIIHERYSK